MTHSIALRSLVLAALITGCAAQLDGPVRALPPAALALLASAPTVYAPAGATRVASAEDLRARAAFEAALGPEARTLVRHDPALDLVAAAVAETISDDQEVPTTAVLQWLFWRSGATSRYLRARPHWWLRGTVEKRQVELDRQVGEEARSVQTRIPLTYGMARFTQGSVTSQAVVYGRAPLQVASFQKTYAPGAPLTLEVRPLEGSTQFSLFADTADGGVSEEPLKPRDDGSFFISRAVPTRPGRYFLEIRARDAKELAADGKHPWRHALLWLPIYVGVPEPLTVDDRFKNPAPTPADPSGWPAWILARYDEERARIGKAPIESDPRLAGLALERAAAAAAVAYELPPDPDLNKKAVTAGLPAGEPYVTSGRIDSLSDYVYQRLLVPSNRKRILLSERLSMGVAVSPRAPYGKKKRVDYDEVEYSLTR